VDRDQAERDGAAPGHAAETEVTAQRIIVRDLSLSCRIGVTAEERARRQRIRLNLSLEVVPDPPTEDRIAEVVHYGHLVDRVRRTCLQANVQLLETLAEQVAANCFFDPRIVSVCVRIEKLDRYADVGGIGIELERRRRG
jgi:7,8-dihydroneopterin aldolase/epimerase/oxygenase